MTELAVRKFEFAQRLAALDGELKAWQTDTSPPLDNQRGRPSPLLRHHSQVQAFAEMLTTVRDAIEPTAQNPLFDDADARDRSKVLLGLFRIWEFLRAKLTQRREPRFEAFLRIADEYAWLCYQPIYQCGLKQPPLVFLNGGYSPFTLTRHDRFQGESVPLELIRSRPLLEVMESLPFPVVGVPWYQYGSFADLTVIGHEVGHSAEADLQLTAAIENAIAGAVDDVVRQTKWKEWDSEVFADLYGVIAGGPAFVSALAHFLAHENSQVETPGYPPVPLRVRFNITALTELGGCAQECTNLAARWNPAFPLAADQDDYVRDLESVAAALLDNVSAGLRKMREWMPIAHHARAREIANKALNREAIKQTEPFCALAAAVRLAYGEVLDSAESADFADRLKRLDGLAAAINAAVVPDLRAGEAERPLAERTAAMQARRESAKLWLSALRAGEQAR